MDINKILANPALREALVLKLCQEDRCVGLIGALHLTMRGPDGRVKGSRLIPNLVVNTGLYHIIDQLQTTPDEAGMGWVAIGNNNAAPAAGDTALSNELGRVALTSKVQGSGGNANQMTYSATVPAGTGTGSIVEAGIFNANSAGVMLSRSIFTAIPKGAGDSLDVSWILSAVAA